MRSFVALLVAVLAACSAQPGAPATVSPSPTGRATSSPAATSPAAASLPPDAIAAIAEIRSSVPRQPMHAASEEQLAELVARDTDFAIRLYRQIIGSEQGDVFISPYSISTALSMAYAGARGKTAQQMAEVMGIGPDAEAWHAARNRLELELAALAARPWASGGNLVPFTLDPVNTMFGQADYPFKRDFTDTLAESYGAGLQTVDFINATEAARRAINSWVADRTRERIPELLAEGDLTELTRFALVNAIYFKANWAHQFDPERTRPEPFRLLDGTTRDVEMMHGRHDLPYARGDGWQAVRLPYYGASMVVLVPDEGRFGEVESMVDADFLRSLSGGLPEYEVDLGLPRWESDSRVDLVENLRAMGIVHLFDEDRADLSGIADVARLFVSHVVHQANVTVDEEGTEAAAATAVIGEEVCACGPDGRVTLTVDRPFLYFIQDATANEILFMGRLLEP